MFAIQVKMLYKLYRSKVKLTLFRRKTKPFESTVLHYISYVSHLGTFYTIKQCFNVAWVNISDALLYPVCSDRWKCVGPLAIKG